MTTVHKSLQWGDSGGSSMLGRAGLTQFCWSTCQSRVSSCVWVVHADNQAILWLQQPCIGQVHRLRAHSPWNTALHGMPPGPSMLGGWLITGWARHMQALEGNPSKAAHPVHCLEQPLAAFSPHSVRYCSVRAAHVQVRHCSSSRRETPLLHLPLRGITAIAARLVEGFFYNHWSSAIPMLRCARCQVP